MKSSKNEKEILDAFENGSLKSISNVKNKHQKSSNQAIYLSVTTLKGGILRLSMSFGAEFCNLP